MLVIATVFLVLATIGLVLATAALVRWQRKGSIVGLVSSFQKQYASTGMHSDLLELARFRDKDGKAGERERILVYLAPLVEDPTKTDGNALAAAERYVKNGGTDLEMARRNVDFHFKSIYQLHKRGYLPLEDFQLIANRSGTDLLLKVVRFLSMADNLVRIQKGDWTKYRAEIPRFEWYREFEAKLAEKPPTPNQLCQRFWSLFEWC